MKASALAWVVFALIMSHSAFGGTCSEIESRTAALNFYYAREANRISDVPTPRELLELKPHTTNGLYKLLSAAIKASGEYERLPIDGTRLPLYEGDLFSSSAEGDANFYISEAVPGSNNMEIYVLYQLTTYAFPYNVTHPGIEEWKERVKVIKEEGQCLVDDIYFAPNSPHESLKKRLKEIVSGAEKAKASIEKEGAASH